MSAPQLVVTRGLPGSGKSTYAKQWVAADPANRARVNRDCLRDLHWPGCYERGPVHEGAVTLTQHATVAALLGGGWQVIVDDMNLDPDIMDACRLLAHDAGVRLEVVDLTAVPVAECVARDLRRPVRVPGGPVDGARVGEQVIRGLAERWLGVGGMVSA